MATQGFSPEAAVNQAVAAAVAPSAEAEPAETAAQAPDAPAKGEATPDVEQAHPPVDEGAELLSEEERKALDGKSPDERIKAFQGAFTRKSQELAEQRKAMEKYEQLIQAFEQDPDATIRYLAEQRGLKLADQEPDKAPAKQQVSEDTVKAFEQELGPELAFLAPKLATAIEAVLNKAVNPIREQHERILAETVQKETESALKAFEAEHPDWKKHEDRITELMSIYQPRPGAKVDESQYLRDIYKLATHGVNDAENTKALAKRMEEAARKSEPSGSGVNTQRVAKAAPKFDSISHAVTEAVGAAMRGETWEE